MATVSSLLVAESRQPRQVQCWRDRAFGLRMSEMIIIDFTLLENVLDIVGEALTLGLSSDGALSNLLFTWMPWTPE